MNNTLQHASFGWARARALTLAGALVVLAGTGAAMAQQEKPLKGSFDQPLQGNHAGQQEDSSSTMMMSESDGSDTYTVKIQGNDVSAEINGQPVPKDQIRHKNGKIEILDKDGDVVKTFNLHVMGNGQMDMKNMPGGTFRVRPMVPGANAMGGGVAMATPPVMMGITMSDSDEGVVVVSVLDDLPAAKAGIKEGDHLLSVDGQKLEGQQALRDVLKDKKPGDTVELKIEREGQNKTIKVKLARFDMEKLQPQGQGSNEPMVFTVPGDHSGAIDDAVKRIQKALDELKANENLKADKIKAKAEKALEEAMDALEKAKDQLSNKLDQWHNDWDQNGGIKLFGNDGKTFVWPSTPSAPDGDVGKQLDKLSEQIERLNKRLDQLEKEKK